MVPPPTPSSVACAPSHALVCSMVAMSSPNKMCSVWKVEWFNTLEPDGMCFGAGLLGMPLLRRTPAARTLGKYRGTPKSYPFVSRAGWTRVHTFCSARTVVEVWRKREGDDHASCMAVLTARTLIPLPLRRARRAVSALSARSLRSGARRRPVASVRLVVCLPCTPFTLRAVRCLGRRGKGTSPDSPPSQ